MQPTANPGQLKRAANSESPASSPFAFPMMVLFGTYAVWILVAGIILLVLNVF